MVSQGPARAVPRSGSGSDRPARRWSPSRSRYLAELRRRVAAHSAEPRARLPSKIIARRRRCSSSACPAGESTLRPRVARAGELRRRARLGPGSRDQSRQRRGTCARAASKAEADRRLRHLDRHRAAPRSDPDARQRDARGSSRRASRADEREADDLWRRKWSATPGLDPACGAHMLRAFDIQLMKLPESGGIFDSRPTGEGGTRG